LAGSRPRGSASSLLLLISSACALCSVLLFYCSTYYLSFSLSLYHISIIYTHLYMYVPITKPMKFPRKTMSKGKAQKQHNFKCNRRALHSEKPKKSPPLPPVTDHQNQDAKMKEKDNTERYRINLRKIEPYEAKCRIFLLLYVTVDRPVGCSSTGKSRATRQRWGACSTAKTHFIKTR
jgi:hypothetical protein